MLHWLNEHAWWLAILSGVLSVVSVLVGFAILIKLPEDYFVRREISGSAAGSRWHIRVVLLVLGLSLTNFPGKRKIELKVLRAPFALDTVNRLRSKAGRAPLRMPSKATRAIR